jgi:hypothetical protein
MNIWTIAALGVGSLWLYNADRQWSAIRDQRAGPNTGCPPGEFTLQWIPDSYTTEPYANHGVCDGGSTWDGECYWTLFTSPGCVFSADLAADTGWRVSFAGGTDNSFTVRYEGDLVRSFSRVTSGSGANALSDARAFAAEAFVLGR